ncbi:N-methyl-L-tryptophan oxidase [Halopiger xanaduensis]|uniref:FAD dependent oxidoreductase n=1 Tax=Halopiger xanaduensis (strain DSM 18323 / JCM 14033 / SH-6) TaxID=797210 RepID=F8DCJ1_HALXS|nr:N-methyl-L-tryptophan oxidase [Halopiger xanaduensis]AEH36033.1 FAD dependent oxidoreductase [Halopiger xanaduensis SH-6]
MHETDDRYDVVVIGVGGMGSATTYHLAERGLDVVGLERYDIPHTMGSSHGITRIIRRAYYEHPDYIPLIERAYDLWDDLAEETGRDVLHRTGSIDAGPEDNVVFEGSLRSCEEHDIPHEVLTSAEVSERFPGYDLPEGHKALYQPDGGFVVPEQAIVGHAEAAQAAGAEVRARERVLDWEPTPDEGVRVETDRDTYEADAMVLAAGAWNYKFTDALEGLAVPERQVLGWFQPERPATFEPDSFPVWNLKVPEGRFYGLPIYDVPGMKLGKYHHFDEDVDPDEYDREPNREDERLLREVVENYFPEAAGPTMRLATCMFTNSPDEHFILDTLPDHPQVAVGAGFSGHGFKFASVIGEILADLAADGETDHPIEMFGLDRFDDA